MGGRLKVLGFILLLFLVWLFLAPRFFDFPKTFAENDQPTQLGIAAPPPGIQTPPPERWWLSRFGWQFIAGEYVKSAGYWAFY